jgi:hypothetical protein
MKKVKIHGASINLDALSGVGSFKELKETGLFSHLTKDEQKDAYSLLWKEVKGSTPVENSTEQE